MTRTEFDLAPSLMNAGPACPLDIGAVDHPVVVIDCATDTILGLNAAAVESLGQPGSNLIGVPLGTVLHAEERTVFNGLDELPRWLVERADGSTLRFRRIDLPLTVDARALCVVSLMDVTASDRQTHRTYEERHFLERVVQTLPAAIFVKDLQDSARYVLCTGATKELASFNGASLLGGTDPELFPPETAAEFASSDRQVASTGQMMTAEATVCQRDGRVIVTETKKMALPEREGPVRYVLGLTVDISARREMEMRLAQLAMRDPLTGLANRSMFRERLRSTLALRQRSDSFVVLHSLDLDHFKGVNDTLGHAAGDAVLIEVARRLEHTCGPQHTIARLGGDEFAVIQGPIASIDEAAELASRISRSLNSPVEIGGRPFVIGSSAGLAVAPDHGDDPDMLLRSADLALYGSKQEGRGSYRFFDTILAHRHQQRHRMEEDLRESIARREFQLCFQPIFDISAGRVTGHEALLRWNHPIRGPVPPSVVVPLAEETGLMVPLGEWVLVEACREAANWAEGRISINLSPVQFRNPGLIAGVEAVLAGSGLDPSRLELEITESVLLADSRANVDTLHQLRALGVRIALDDFGTGYSSLGYLGAFPFHKIKIDRSLTREIVGNANGLAIVRSVIKLADDLGMSTTAEGVETEEQLEILAREGCCEAQGFLIDMPRPASELKFGSLEAPRSAAA